MEGQTPKKWLLLIHHIPPKPNALRVKAWRRLQQVGAVAIKPSVYVMPPTDEALEDLSWILKEIIEGGGDGSISEAEFIEGLTHDQIRAIFVAARRTDYEKLIQEALELRSEWTAVGDSEEAGTRDEAPLAKLQRRFEDIAAIDYFRSPDRDAAESLLRELESLISGRIPGAVHDLEPLGDLRCKTWVTRSRIFIDRLACSWLIRKFIDDQAGFKFVTEPKYVPLAGEIRFDMFDGEFTHVGDRCTFEGMIRRLELADAALRPMAEIVHDVDMKDKKFGRPETGGFQALITGLVSEQTDDHLRLAAGLPLFDHLYAYFQRQK